MITNRNTVLIIFLLLYILPELFFENAMVYLSGVIGGTISEIFRGSSERPSNVLVFVVWAILLIGLVLLFVRVQYKPVKYLILLLIAFFLYIVDNLLAVVPIFETQSKQSALIVKYVVMVLSILIKSAVLTWVYWKGNRSQKKGNASQLSF
ncbi:MAG: hypothetical protein JWN76_3548 [Chitinophagaceae bacterium]|nr:hypothetical protein [Chitinophagaceae bacterium]